MFSRLGLSGRLILIVLLLVLALATLGIGLGAVSRETKEFATSRLAVPKQTAAIVALLDASDASQWPAIARAVASPELTLGFEDQIPAVQAEADRMPGVEWLISDFLDAKGRTVEVVRSYDSEPRSVRRFFERSSADSTTPITITIELANKRFAVFTLPGATTRRIFGIPYGFWVGAVGFLLSALAILAIAREARPLRALSDAVQRFAESGAPEPVAASGAPEIRGLIGAFNRMQARIATLLAGRTMMLGAISHDLRTLLTRLRLRIEAIPDAESREKATREIEDMTAMLEDGMAVARGLAASERKMIISVADLISDSLSAVELHGIEWSAPTSTDSYNVIGDPVALRRVVGNLVDNALQHAAHCRVALACSDKMLTLTVDDDGPGVAESQREMIFEPFYRGDESRNRCKASSGLGLAIVRTIVEGHGGEISVSRSMLGGASFAVTLPRA